MFGAQKRNLHQKSVFKQLFQPLGLLTAFILCGTQLNAQTTWVAFNDHAPGAIGTQTSPNATTLNCLVSPGSVNLINIVDGSALTAVMEVTITGSGISGGSSAGVPTPGTPLANTFDGYVYFGTGSNPSSAIQVRSGSTLTLTFTNLDPGRRYIFKGGTVRGNYADRWGLFDIQGAASVLPNHQQGAASPWGILDATRVPGSLSGYQIAINTGNNVCGDMIEWDEIDPGPDGGFTVTSTQYTGTVPAGYGTDPNPGSTGGTYGYAINGIRLEEYIVGGPLTVRVSPSGAQSIQQCSTMTFTASGGGGTPDAPPNPPYSYQWYKVVDGVTNLISGETAANLTFANAQPVNDGTYVVKITDSSSPPTNEVFSEQVSLTVTPDNVAPALVSPAVGGPDLYNVTVSFTKPIAVSGPSAIAIQCVDDATSLAVSSAIVTNGTNVILTTTDPRGKNYQVVVQASGVTDACNGQAVAAGSSARVEDVLILVGFNFNNTWFYNQTGYDQGTAWKEISFPEEAIWDQGQAAFDAKDVPRNVIGGVPVRTQLLLTNLASPITTDLPTYYFRTHVQWPANIDPEAVSVSFRTLWDDGGILYINGNEVYRDPNVTAANEIFSAYQGGTAVGNAAISAPQSIDPSIFVEGDNVVCVLLKQVNAASSDITMGLEIDATVTNYFITGGPLIFRLEPTSANIVQCDNLTLQATVQGGTRPYSYQWYKGASPVSDGGSISGATTSKLVFTGAQSGDSGDYHLHVTDGALVGADSDVIPVTVALEPAPQMVSAIGAADMQTVTVTFNEPVSLSGSDGGDFFLHAVDGSHDLIFNDSYELNGGMQAVLFSYEPRQPNKDYQLVVTSPEPGRNLSSKCSGQVLPVDSMIQIACEFRPFGVDGTVDGTTWQYNEAGIDLGPDWLLNSYDDHNADDGWATGTSLFDGKRQATPRTVVSNETVRTTLQLTNSVFPLTTQVIPTYYFRTHFDLQADPSQVSLSCRTFFDDYGIIYINGQEAFRNTNIVATNEGFSYYTEIDPVINEGGYSLPIPLPTTNLVNGDNIIAVYLKQSTPGSSDITMGLELTAIVTNFSAAVPHPHLTITRGPNANQVTIDWDSGVLLESTDLINWTESADQTKPQVRTLPEPGTPYKFFGAR